jgi:hypothetical protein
MHVLHDDHLVTAFQRRPNQNLGHLIISEQTPRSGSKEDRKIEIALLLTVSRWRSLSESRMLEMGTSGLMSGEGRKLRQSTKRK